MYCYDLGITISRFNLFIVTQILERFIIPKVLSLISIFREKGGKQCYEGHMKVSQ
jgi:hypothetical protein